jgi:hypothetical protein
MALAAGQEVVDSSRVMPANKAPVGQRYARLSHTQTQESDIIHSQSSHYEDSVKPVTIKQVLDAQQISDKDWKIDGNNVKQVCIIIQSIQLF